ncbi:DENN domain-containing protein 5B-like isoform X4 [Varroa jacobsoni]|uniref:DENN domain-containing protein 5B-like isoform X4 n=1 Tax=Varroa jacobsoni TaxID=62625 RepID=UPI000BF972CA|nr:DENN domain-containing protein 5B-like isoform X4 [Varroa jacobsoni]
MDSNDKLALCSNGRRLVDYVVVCGLDLNNGLEPNSQQGEQSQVTPLERSYKSQALVHFPEHVEGHTIDPNSINMLCLPSGLTFCTQKKMKVLESNSWFHTFIVTRADGSRSYGHALLFYEEVGDRDVCTALHTLQQMYLAELNEARAHSSGIISRSLPRSFRLLSPKLATKKVHSEPVGALYDPNKDTLYSVKAICLISTVPIVCVAKVILQSWHRMITAAEPPQLPYECYLYNVLYELPMPDQGKSVQLCHLYDEIIFQQPGSMELPHFDYSFRELILLLGVENLLQLFTSVLFENQVLLCASDYYKLMLVAECVTALLFPFAWAHVYVPVLPAPLHNFLDAPVPYIMGLCTAGQAPEVLANIVPGEANLCLVDLDNCRVKVPEDLPPFPHRQELARELVDTLTNVFKLPLPEKPAFSTTASSVVESMVPSTIVIAPVDELRTPSTPDREARADKKRRSSKKHSLPFLDISVDSEKLAVRERASFSGILPTPQQISQHHSDVFHKVHAVAKKVVDTPDNLRKSRKKSTSNLDDQGLLRSPPVLTMASQHGQQGQLHTPTNPALEELCINNAVREIFLNRFLSMFCGYEQFVVHPPSEKKTTPEELSPNLADIESWLSNNRETSLQNFDKTSFLSDQPQQHLAFLSKFIETQMFTSFIDAKVLQTQQETADKSSDAHGPEKQSAPSPTQNNDAAHDDVLLAARDNTGTRFVAIFDTRLHDFKEKLGGELLRYIRCNSFTQSAKPIELRLACPDMVLPAPKRSQESMVYSQHKQGVFNHWTLNKGYLNGTGPTEYKRRRSSADRGDRDAYGDPHLTIQQQRRRSSKQRIVQENSSAALIRQSNWKFVEQLLNECKQKTKRMCVEKMGYAEAVEMGHKRASDNCKTSTIEENTLIAGLCDLLERIWSHGLQTKQGKSALWAHLQNFLEIEDGKQSGKETNYLSPDLSSATDLSSEESMGSGNKGSRFATMNSLPTNSLFSSSVGGARDRDSRDKNRRGLARTAASSSAPPRRHSATPSLGDPIAPLAASLANDIRFVQAMEEVKTDIGFARAWVRLSLEKKCLSKHLKTLLSNQELLRNLYKRHAFLRSDDEKEYFVHYLLTLNALDYTCFTTSYVLTVLPYRVTIFPTRKHHSQTTQSNLWVTVSGTLAHTDKPLHIPKPSFEIVFKARNLGTLTTMRVGYDGTGLNPKTTIENVLVRNELTGQCVRFPAGKWLGRGLDDLSTERLLIAEHLALGMPETEIYELCRSTTRPGSPSFPRRSSDPKITVQEVQQLVNDAVVTIVKHHHRPQNEKSTLTALLCGEFGLVYALDKLFNFGFKQTMIQRPILGVRGPRHLFLWDFFLRVQEFFEEFLSENESVLDAKNRDEHFNVMNGYINIVSKIEKAAAHTVGKDQRFQAFICFALRERFLHRMMVHVASTPVTSQMFDEQSFLRDSSLLTFLVQMLENLVQVDFADIEEAITLNVL